MTLSKAEQAARLVRKAGVFRPRELDRVGIPRQYLRRAKDRGGFRSSPILDRTSQEKVSGQEFCSSKRLNLRLLLSTGLPQIMLYLHP